MLEAYFGRIKADNKLKGAYRVVERISSASLELVRTTVNIDCCSCRVHNIGFNSQIE